VGLYSSDFNDRGAISPPPVPMIDPDTGQHAWETKDLREDLITIELWKDILDKKSSHDEADDPTLKELAAAYFMRGLSGRNVRKATKWLKVDAPITPANPATPITPTSPTSPAANFPPFIPATRLVTYLRENLPRILIELFQNEDDRPFEQEILNGDHCYTRIFAILLLIEQPWLIVEFLDKPNLSDHSGPFYGENPPPEFPEGANWEEFKKQQWQFFAHSFNRHGRDLKIDSNVPLPFVAVSRISSGGSAHIYKVTVEPEYNAMVCHPNILKSGKQPQSICSLD
jgi:hypothetical protein